MKKHLAILNSQAIKAIILGKKNIEARFSQKKIAPFGMVNCGDVVLLKPPGEEIAGQFEVTKVISIDGMDESAWQWIKKEFGQQIFFGTKADRDRYFGEHSGAKYATIIYIGRVEQFIASPIRIEKKDLRGWVVLGED